MSLSLGAIIRTARDRAGLSQAQLADKLGITSQAVSQWERGETVPDSRNLLALMRELDIPKAELISEPWDLPFDSGETAIKHVPLVGYVGAGDQAHFYAVNQGALDEIAAPQGSTLETAAVEIRGDSLGSLFDRWLVFYDQVRSPVTSDLIGRLCVVGLADDRVLIKKLKKGTKMGLYTLLSEREPAIENVAVEWAAPVKNMSPK